MEAKIGGIATLFMGPTNAEFIVHRHLKGDPEH
jgi:hypothetical protein